VVQRTGTAGRSLRGVGHRGRWLNHAAGAGAGARDSRTRNFIATLAALESCAAHLTGALLLHACLRDVGIACLQCDADAALGVRPLVSFVLHSPAIIARTMMLCQLAAQTKLETFPPINHVMGP
jgi:hypothetical protein